MAHKERHTASKKKGGAVKILLAVVLLLVLAAGAAVLFARSEIHGSGKPGTEVTVSIKQGSGVAAIAQELKDAGVIRSSYLFRWYVGHKGAAAKLQYGDFDPDRPAAPMMTSFRLSSTYAKAETVRITIPEGTTAIAIAQKMEEAGLCSAEDFLKEANEGDFSAYTFWQYVPEDKDAPDRFMKCEGYLFPETYEFLKDDTVHNYVATFYAQFDAQITDAMYAKLKEQGMTLNELVTLASFVQEEAGNSQDSNVAQVFRNRLAEGSPYPRLQSNTSSHIQSDADNNYLWNWVAPYYGGWDNIPENIVSAYDTYHTAGLTPGPISNPGIAAIKAALEPGPGRGGKGRLFLRHRPQGQLLLCPHPQRTQRQLPDRSGREQNGGVRELYRHFLKKERNINYAANPGTARPGGRSGAPALCHQLRCRCRLLQPAGVRHAVCTGQLYAGAAHRGRHLCPCPGPQGLPDHEHPAHQ